MCRTGRNPDTPERQRPVHTGGRFSRNDRTPSRASADEDAARIYNDTEYGLSMAVITESYRKMRYFRDECEYGMGYVNLPCIGAEVHLPFGGVKKSGNGHPSAAGLIETVTHKIAWTVNHGTEIKMAQGLTTGVEGGGT